MLCNRFKFNGQQLDPITGQYYLRARFYNPVIARFTQEDTYRGDGLNLYAYCRNNPVYYVDPTGHVRKCVKAVFEAAIKAGKSIAEAEAIAEAEFEANKANRPTKNKTGPKTGGKGLHNQKIAETAGKVTDGTQYGINVGKTTAKGAPFKREAEAINDLEDADIEMHYVQYD